MIHITVPATSANMGPGFDSIGIALKLYNHVWVEKTAGGLIIESKNGQNIPTDESNLIYRSLLEFYKRRGLTPDFGGLHIMQEDNIPMTRGLGSSAACIVAGLLAANELSSAGLSKHDLAELAAELEGHPDNSTPAIIGGMTVGAMAERMEYCKLDLNPLLEKGVRFGVMIPEFPLSTEKAREVLPASYSREDVVFNASRAALMVCAVMKGDTSLLMTAMDDRIHQPYRARIIPNMEDIFATAKRLGALGVFLSGAGPTLICVYDNDKVREGMCGYLAALEGGWTLTELAPDTEGATVTTE